MIHVYAFVDEVDRLPATEGVAGGSLELLCAAGMTAVVSRIPAGADTSGREATLAHGLVVEQLLDAARAVVPVRFGEQFDDSAAFAAAVAARAAGLKASLDLVRGCAEIEVRIAPTAAPAEAASGTAYLHARLADEAQLAALGERLGPYTCAATAPAGGSVAYLVRRDHAEPALLAAGAFAEEHPELAIRCTGPWAPYSFAGGAS